MPYYRTIIPYAATSGKDAGRILRFAAHLGAANAQEARRGTVNAYQSLCRAVGLGDAPEHDAGEVLFEEPEERVEVKLEMSSLEVRPGVFCMAASGALDSHTALRMDREIHRLQRLNTKALVIDLDRVHPVGTAGLGVLLSASDRLKLRLVRVPSAVRKMMETLGLETTLQCFDSFGKALASLA